METPLSRRPHAPDWETLLPTEREELLSGWARRVHHCVRAADQNLGHLEEELLHGGHELFRQMLEAAAQQKAAAAPPLCPQCQNQLSRLTAGHATTIQTRFGAIRVARARGYCRRCPKWRFPADALLGLPEQGTQSPAVQEIAALLVSKMPAPEARQVVERLTGLKLSAATLARIARGQGQRAQAKRQSLNAQMSTAAGCQQQDRDLQLQLALDLFTLVIELDAWNIRERDEHWGQGAALRAAGQEPASWHWAYGGTCFRLNQRAQTAGGRPSTSTSNPLHLHTDYLLLVFATFCSFTFAHLAFAATTIAALPAALIFRFFFGVGTAAGALVARAVPFNFAHRAF